MKGVETLKGFVNTWDCDENDHLNVQFYVRFFEDAGDHFQALYGIAAAERRSPIVRHVRYHSELRKNEAVVVTSARTGPGQIVHMLVEPASGRLSATCLETYAEPLSETIATAGDSLPDQTRPRSVDPLPVAVEPAFSVEPVVLRTRIRAEHCRPDGDIFDSAVVGFNSDSASFFWDNIGVNEPWLRERNLGRVAVEMKLTRTGRAEFGDLLHVTSRPIAVARSTITFENRFFCTETGGTAAIIQVTGLTMNLTARRAEPLPEDLKATVEKRIAADR